MEKPCLEAARRSTPGHIRSQPLLQSKRRVSGKPKTLGLKCKRMFQVRKRREAQNKSHSGITAVSGKDWQ